MKSQEINLFGDEPSKPNGFPFTTRPNGQIYEFYLVGEIEPADDYIMWFDTIRNATANDVVKLYINSPGGDLVTALQFLRVLNDTPATVTCSIEGECISAATIIFLAGDILEVSPNSLFMVHTYSSGSIGKGNELHLKIHFEREWSKKLFHSVYKGFLTTQEINDVLDGKDMWMDSDEVILRCENRAL